MAKRAGRARNRSKWDEYHHYPRRGIAPQHPHRRVPVGDGEGRSEPRPGGVPAPQPRPRSTRKVSCGAARTAGLVRPRWCRRFLEHRIGDRRVLRLIGKWLRAGVIHPGEGPPQGADRRPALRAPQQASGDRKLADDQLDLFADFNGLRAERQRPHRVLPPRRQLVQPHDPRRQPAGSGWPPCAEREGLRGKVQCIYLDPPYGIKFNSNFQWSTTSRDVHPRRQSRQPHHPRTRASQSLPRHLARR